MTFLLDMTMNHPALFDQLHEHFNHKIYQSLKGKLRLSVLEADFMQQGLHTHPLNILDIGAGGGQFALKLAQQGHQLTLVEPSMHMLQYAKTAFQHAKCPAHFYQASIETLPTLNLPSFDLVLCHAVLEWTPSPIEAVKQLLPFVGPRGWLSILFYNLEGLVLHNLIRANFKAVQKAQQGGMTGSLTPISPISLPQMDRFICQHHLTPLQQSGVRIFHDFMTKENRDKIAEDELIATELQYRQHQSFFRSARYIHYLLRYDAPL